MAKALADTTAQMLINANVDRMRAEQAALLEAQLDTTRVEERDRLVELNNVLRDELQYYEEQITTLEKQMSALRTGLQSNETEARLLSLHQELLAYRNERVSLLASLAEAHKSLIDETQRSKAEVDTVVVVEEALLPVDALPRNILQPLLAALAGGLGLALALAYGIEYLDYTVKSPEELDAIYGIPTQAVIGHVNEAANARERGESLIMITAPRSPIAEAIRSLRTSVRMAGIKDPVRSLLITSGGPGEGKTFITTNLAISIAQAGKRVILVDLDLRRPQVHKAFGLAAAPGFTNLIVDRDEIDLAQVLRPTMVPNLRVLPCGEIPPNPSELLGSEQTARLMERLSAAADVVIYDTPPAATVTDAVLIAPLVDGVLQVVNSRGPRIDMVLRTKDFLERAGARVIGPVLNRVALNDLGYYANYYYYGSYYNREQEKQQRSKVQQDNSQQSSPHRDNAHRHKTHRHKRRWPWLRRSPKAKPHRSIYEVETAPASSAESTTDWLHVTIDGVESGPGQPPPATPPAAYQESAYQESAYQESAYQETEKDQAAAATNGHAKPAPTKRIYDL
ncbi:MAG: CpsD/CapB family tyrosine-protein kinase [Caldilineaceae bacterium]